MRAFLRCVAILGVGLAACRCPAPGAPGTDTTPIFSTITVKCGSSQYTLTTGDDGGKCRTTSDASGNTTGGTCLDTNGNGAHATCQGNGGDGRCVSSAGSGSCSQTARTRTPAPSAPPPGAVDDAAPGP